MNLQSVKGLIGVVYTRVSSDGQEDNTSHEEQKQSGLNFFESLGVKPYKIPVFSDTVTGKLFAFDTGKLEYGLIS